MRKRFKFWLAFGLIISSIISFGYCDNSLLSPVQHDLTSSSSFQSSCNGLCCFMSSTASSTLRQAVRFNGDYQLFPSSLTLYGLSCVSYSGNFVVSTSQGSTTALKFYDLSNSIPSTSCPDCPTCQENYCMLSINQNGIDNDYTCSGDCNFDIYLEDDIVYTGYNNPGGATYFTMAGICSYTGVENSGDWSALYINDIQHLGAGIINVTIPAEIEWDYIYTGNGEQFDLNVKGYNVDTDYIEGIINTQNSKPNKVDFNNTITGLLPIFVPGLVIILLLYFIFRFIKKIF